MAICFAAVAVTEAAADVYTYYSNGRLQSKTLDAPDASGAVCYHYLNENFKLRGYGRIDRQVLAQKNGEGAIAYAFTYQSSTSEVVRIKRCYGTVSYSSPGNPVFSNLVVTYLYYTSGRIQTKSFVNPDQYGNKTYYYYNEAFYTDANGTRGRLMRVYKADGSILVYQSYYTGTDIPQLVREYDKSMRAVATYSYYPKTGYLQYKALAAPDASKNKYFHYMNENFEGKGYGRIDKLARSVKDAEGALGYIYTYHGTTGVIATKRLYARVYYSSPVSPLFLNIIATYSYNETGMLVKKALSNGTTYTYYTDTGFLASVARPSPDGAGIIYTHYLNEQDAWNIGHGREDIEEKAAADASGNKVYYYTYEGDSYVRSSTEGYQVVDNTTDPGYPILISYYASGNIKAKKYTRPVYDPYPVSVYMYTYIDEDYYGGHRGRIASRKTSSGYMFYTYYGNTETLSGIEYRDLSDVVYRIDTFYENGRLEGSYHLQPDEQGNVYYHYIDETWEGSDHGRLDASQLAVPNEKGEAAFEYTYYSRLWPPPFSDTRTATVHCIYSYLDEGRAIPYAAYEYDREGNLINTVTYAVTYYESGRKESETLSTADEYGCIYYHYMDEDWAGAGYGRVDKKGFASPGEYGEIAEEYQYFPGSDLISSMNIYTGADYSNPSAPVFTSNAPDGSREVAFDETYVYVIYYKNNYKRVLKTRTTYLDDAKTVIYGEWEYQYYYNYMGIPGNDQNILIKNVYHCPSATFQYYQSGDVRSKRLAVADGDGRISYEYDEAGRITKEMLASADASGAIGFEYFYDASGQKTGERVYKVSSYTDYQFVTIGGERVWKYTTIVDEYGRKRMQFAFDPLNGNPPAYAVHYHKPSNSYWTEALWGTIVIEDTMSGTQLIERAVFTVDPLDPYDKTKWSNKRVIDMNTWVGFSASASIDPSSFIWYSSNLPELTPEKTVILYESQRPFIKFDSRTGITYEYEDSESGRVLKETSPDGSYRVFTYDGASKDPAKEKRYSASGKLLEERIAMAQTEEFIKMANLAWSNYGHDLGIDVCAATAGTHDGYSANPARLYNKLAKWEGQYVRIFLFCDLRAGISFAADGTPIGFNDTATVYADMQALLNTAAALNIKLIPTLLDYRMADNVSGDYWGEHPDLITDPVKRAELIRIFSGFISDLQTFANNDAIYAWDVMNEPEMSCESRENVVQMEGENGMKEFVKRLIEMIHVYAPGSKVTVGSFEKGDMIRHWAPLDAEANRNVDILQFHYYDGMSAWHASDYERLDHHTASLDQIVDLAGRPVIAGELSPTYVESKIETLADHGYGGALFWDDVDNPEFNMDPEEVQALKDWFYGYSYTYYESSGLVASERRPSSDGSGWIYRHYRNEDLSHFTGAPNGEHGHGRIDQEVLAMVDADGAKGYEYECYFPSGIKVRRSYHTVTAVDSTTVVFSDPVSVTYYNTDGTVSGKDWISTYYADTWYKSSDVFASPDQWGNVYKYYINERDQWQCGHGRELLELRETADGDGAKGYKYDYDGDSYNRIGIWKYQDISYDDPNNPQLIGLISHEMWGAPESLQQSYRDPEMEERLILQENMQQDQDELENAGITALSTNTYIENSQNTALTQQ